jgi:hypothetical protein
MAAIARPCRITRLLALAALAYLLALNGLLGSIAAGAHVAEARMAAQLGVICTIHGIDNDAAGQSDDPTPGKLACIEHCVISVASAMPALASAGTVVDEPAPQATAASLPTPDAGRRIAPVSGPPQPRGPPALI